MLASLRRGLLSTACLLLVFSIVQQPLAGDTQIEGALYEGNTSGDWACGPRGAVRYGGVGARVHYSQREPTRQNGKGASLVVGAALEAARLEINRDSEPDTVRLATEHEALFAAADVRLGYHWHYFGFEVGAMRWAGWKSNAEREAALFPQLELSGGPRDIAYGVLGFGVTGVTRSNRPSLPYLGLGLQSSPGYRFELRVGVFRAGPAVFDDSAPTADFAWYLPIERDLDLRLSLALGANDDIQREASVGISFSP